MFCICIRVCVLHLDLHPRPRPAPTGGGIVPQWACTIRLGVGNHSTYIGPDYRDHGRPCLQMCWLRAWLLGVLCPCCRGRRRRRCVPRCGGGAHDRGAAARGARDRDAAAGGVDARTTTPHTQTTDSDGNVHVIIAI